MNAESASVGFSLSTTMSLRSLIPGPGSGGV
jgi:hypothetical protein